MGLFSRSRLPSLRRRSGAGTAATTKVDVDAAAVHLQQFHASRQGVEAFVEPATTITPTTLLLIAETGEWTRRPVDDPRAATDLARRLGVPVYDINLVGYPQRMRAWNASRAQREREAGPPG